MELLDIYERKDYEKKFKDIFKIKKIRDTNIIKQLDEIMLEAFNNSSNDIILIIPEIVEYNRGFDIIFKGKGKSKIYDDASIKAYKEYLGKDDNITIDKLKEHELCLIDMNSDNEEKPKTIKGFSLYKCVSYGTKLETDNCTYYLHSGN